jgi:hypothetical protein
MTSRLQLHLPGSHADSSAWVPHEQVSISPDETHAQSVTERVGIGRLAQQCDTRFGMQLDNTYRRRRTSFEVRSAHGFRTFELWEGDITTLPFPTDLLVVSAFAGDYVPTQTSVIGALGRLGIDVGALARNPTYDFRNTPLRSWVSAPLLSSSKDAVHVINPPKFGRIMCVEMEAGLPPALGSVFSSLFGVLALMDQQLGSSGAIRTIAMPALGTGDQGHSVAEVVDQLVTSARDALGNARHLERLVFVAYSADVATAFQNALETRLERVRVQIGSGRVKAARADAAAKVSTVIATGRIETTARPIFEDLHRLLSWDDAGNFELGIAGRRLAEFVVAKKLGPKYDKKRDLLSSIEALAEQHVADWTRSYLHTLRVFGNESAHAKNSATRTPAILNSDDVELWCLCLHRILDFAESLLGRDTRGIALENQLGQL